MVSNLVPYVSTHVRLLLKNVGIMIGPVPMVNALVESVHVMGPITVLMLLMKQSVIIVPSLAMSPVLAPLATVYLSTACVMV